MRSGPNSTTPKPIFRPGSSSASSGRSPVTRSLAQRLVADSEFVLDVPPRCGCFQDHGRKTDKDDAVSIGLAALDMDGVAQVAPDDATVSLRLLCDRREELGALRGLDGDFKGTTGSRL